MGYLKERYHLVIDSQAQQKQRSNEDDEITVFQIETSQPQPAQNPFHHLPPSADSHPQLVQSYEYN